MCIQLQPFLPDCREAEQFPHVKSGVWIAGLEDEALKEAIMTPRRQR